MVVGVVTSYLLVIRGHNFEQKKVGGSFIKDKSEVRLEYSLLYQ